MALCLTAVAVGLLVSLAYGLVQRGAREPSTFALSGLVVIVLGQGTTPYFYPFGVGLLLGLAYDMLEDEWCGAADDRTARFSYRARLFLKSATGVWTKRHLGGRVFVEGLGPSITETCDIPRA